MIIHTNHESCQTHNMFLLVYFHHIISPNLVSS